MSYTWHEPPLSITFASLEQIAPLTRPGHDASDAVEDLIRLPSIASQMNALDPGAVRRILRDAGGWDADELDDRATNLRRLLWLSACTVTDEPDLYADTP